MTLNFPFVVLALLLLWFPREWMRRGAALLRRRRRAGQSRIVEPWREREAGDPRINFRAEFTKFRNHIDLLRGMAGSLVLFGGMGILPAIEALPGASRTVTLQVLAIRALILLIGLLIQTVRYQGKKLTFFPPIFYLAGLSVGLCDIRGAAFAFVLIWAINPALPSAQTFLSVYAVLLVVFGHFFAWGGDLRAVYAGVLCFLPVLLSMLAKRPLVVFGRKRLG
jgi:hypothetical protein